MSLHDDLRSFDFAFPGDDSRLGVVVLFLQHQDIENVSELAGVLCLSCYLIKEIRVAFLFQGFLSGEMIR